MNLGFGFGSFLGGVIFETSGGYQLALIVNVVLGIVAAIAAALVPLLGHERQRRSWGATGLENSSIPARATG
jgi:predicted MFS family arabinose efflux permease